MEGESCQKHGMSMVLTTRGDVTSVRGARQAPDVDWISLDPLNFHRVHAEQRLFSESTIE